MPAALLASKNLSLLLKFAGHACNSSHGNIPCRCTVSSRHPDGSSSERYRYPRKHRNMPSLTAISDTMCAYAKCIIIMKMMRAYNNLQSVVL